MAFVSADRVQETSTTTGTGTYTLAGAVADFQSFAAIGDGNTCYYTAVMAGGGWEVGIGTYTASGTTLARTKILSSSNSNAAVSWAAGTKTIFCDMPARGIFPPGHIFGLTMSNAADTANDITIAAGSCRDDTDQVDIRLPAAITKQLDAGWAVGTNAGGLNTGAEANSTWYEVHGILRPDTGVVDVMFTTTANRATLPTNYVYKRPIGWIRNDGAGALLQFTQVDDYFTLTTQANDASFQQTTTAAAVTLTAPPNSVARMRACLQGIGSSTNADCTVLSEIVEGNVTPATTTGIATLTTGDSDIAASVMSRSALHLELRVSSSSQIEHDSNVTGTAVVDISTFGWIDSRGRST